MDVRFSHTHRMTATSAPTIGAFNEALARAVNAGAPTSARVKVVNDSRRANPMLDITVEWSDPAPEPRPPAAARPAVASSR